MQYRSLIFYFILLIWHAVVLADSVVDSVGFMPTNSKHANWMFAGTVVNDESGENFNYIFQIERNGEKFHAFVLVMDGQTNEISVVEDSQAIIQNAEDYNWNVGRAFLRFNPINASWVLGIVDKNKFSFNFKIDLLKPSQQLPVTQELRRGVGLIILSTGQLNGVIKRKPTEPEQFVTASTTWFRQLWLMNDDVSLNHIKGLLCQFYDWSGLYSVSILEPDALRGSIASAIDAGGKLVKISQFVDLKENEKHDWQINITSPASQWLMKSVFTNELISTGLIQQKNTTGFCVISRDNLGG